MNEAEKEYIARIQEVMARPLTAVQIVDVLVAREKPQGDQVSLNTQTIINEIEALDFEREDGALDRSFDSNEDYDKEEMKIAENILKAIKKIINDLQNGNIYSHRYWISLVYSRLKDGNYSYRSIEKPADVSSREGAEVLSTEIKANTPKEHPEEPDFTLEDIRIGAEIVDTSGKKVSLY